MIFNYAYANQFSFSAYVKYSKIGFKRVVINYKLPIIILRTLNSRLRLHSLLMYTYNKTAYKRFKARQLDLWNGKPRFTLTGLLNSINYKRQSVTLTGSGLATDLVVENGHRLYKPSADAITPKSFRKEFDKCVTDPLDVELNTRYVVAMALDTLTLGVFENLGGDAEIRNYKLVLPDKLIHRLDDSRTNGSEKI